MSIIRENGEKGREMTKYVKPNANCDSSRICPASPARRNREPVKHEFPERSFPEEISAPPAKNIPAKRSVASNDEPLCSKPFRFTANSLRVQTEFEIRNSRL